MSIPDEWIKPYQAQREHLVSLLTHPSAYDDMYYLIDKYAPFPQGEGPLHLSQTDRAILPAEKDHRKND